MWKLKLLFAAALLALPLGTLAQSRRAHGQSSNAGQSQFSAAMTQEIGKIDSQFLAAAEAMPEDKFNFTPESLNIPGSQLKGVRTFAMQVKHVAADNFSIWAPLTGKPEPAGINAPAGPEQMKSRAEILKFLQDSMAYSHKAVTGLTAENALQMVEFRGKKMTRLSLAVLALTHMNDHYGQIVEYLRLSGIVPPASR
jgi:uncharacterized damage-inducible protein DinB